MASIVNQTPSLDEIKQIHSAQSLSSTSTIKTNSKDDDDFRTYDVEKTTERVVEHYRLMRSKQTVEFVERMGEKYTFEGGVGRKQMTIDEAFEELEVRWKERGERGDGGVIFLCVSCMSL